MNVPEGVQKGGQKQKHKQKPTPTFSPPIRERKPGGKRICRLKREHLRKKKGRSRGKRKEMSLPGKKTLFSLKKRKYRKEGASTRKAPEGGEGEI